MFKVLGALFVSLLSIYLSFPQSTFAIGNSVSDEKVSNLENCLDILGLHYRVKNQKRKEITEDWLGSFDICPGRPTAKAPKTLELNFGLTPTSSETDYKKVVKFLKKVKSAPSPVGQTVDALGGESRDVLEASRITPAFEKDAEAQYLIGYIYLNGYLGKADRKKAVKFLKIAADQGHLQASTLLAEIETP